MAVLRTPRKLEELINLHADLAGQIANLNTVHPDGYCIASLMKALKIITKNTRLEGEVMALIETCEGVLNEK